MSEIDKDALAAAAVHDLRAPLNACLMSLSLLELKASDPDEVLKAVGVIRRNLEKQAGLLDDVADAMQLIGGGLVLERKAADIADAIDAGIERARSAAPLQIQWQRPPEPLAADADTERLERAFAALLEALAAGADESAHIEVCAAARGAGVRVEMRRSAPAEHTPERAPARKRPVMRLSVAGEVIERHGGRYVLGEDGAEVELPSRG